MSFLAELKRRNVIRVAGLYLAGAWLVVQVAGTVLPMVDAPAWLTRAVVFALAIGFLPAMVFAWAFEITPEGLKREHTVDPSQSITPHTGKTLDRMIMVVLALSLGYFAFDKFVLDPQRDAERAREARQEGRNEALVESYGDKSIAVLPFVDMSPEKDQEYFSDGIAEELLNLLAKIEQLRVISRSSAFSFKGKDIAIPEIAKQLNVAHILEGSVRKAGDQVRITAQLIEARSDTHLWSRTWDRHLDDVFAVQDEIAAAVVEQLKITLLGEPPKAQEVDAEAYALYLQAKQAFREHSSKGYEQSIELLQHSMRRDSTYAPAWNALAFAYLNQMLSGARPSGEGIRLMREAATKALALDPEFAPAHGALGYLAMYTGNPAAASSHYERALTLEPTNVYIIGNAADLAMHLGRLDMAIKLNQYAIARDPLDPIGYHALCNLSLMAGHLDQALANCRTVLRLAPDFLGGHFMLGEALLLKGNTEAALAEMEKEAEKTQRLVGLTMVYHSLGRTEDSDATLAELVAQDRDQSAFSIAYAMAWRNEPDRAFEWLHRAVAQQEPGLLGMAFDPLLANLHVDPRWLPFLRKIGKAPDQLAAIKFDVKLPR